MNGKMSGVREKGKIAHSEWSKIVARYRAGESIAQIGRDYGCTAPAIRYIIKRAGAFGATGGAVRASAASSNPIARAAPTTDGGGGLAADLRERVSGDIASFLVALDQAVVEGSSRSVAELQEATDRLMRSTARVRLELERLLGGEQAAMRGRPLKPQSVTSARGA
jgi:hypothetical protein